ncbi:hypothetical protein V6N13_056229 [Hibiscus sabdariffa]|uniref:Uncharacterized protein n=1 Tax=Hibiscus sabdariffa TaxID=183260 RepID=A0ABR2BCQ1_9ROSI
MLTYNTTESSSSSSKDLEIIKTASHESSDEENTSSEVDENIEIPKHMDIDPPDPDPRGKRKLYHDLFEDDKLRSFNKNIEQDKNTTRIIEDIATNEVKTEQTGESSQAVPYVIDSLNKRNAAQGGVYLDLINIPISDYEKVIDD